MIDYFQDQERIRNQFLERILTSRSPRKLIIAGPGTGKTYTFSQLFQRLPPGPKIALTFIRKLVQDMTQDFEGRAEASTFHKYCKSLLHRRFGSVELAPYLPKLITEDSMTIGREYPSFVTSFQTLREGSPEVEYYLKRGRYYRAVSFDDSVYLVYRAVIEGRLELPRFNQIVIDEYQDFNPLEVAFIDQLQERGNILIVGDDDQAVYLLRNASPEHLRNKFRSTEYEIFNLPYCSRCPRVVVESTSAFITQICSRNSLSNRIAKPFYPFLEGNELLNRRYTRIIKGTTTNIACLSNFIQCAIQRIPKEEIEESHEKEYPTALIIGQKQYLQPIYKYLKKKNHNVSYSPSEKFDYSIINGYDLLLSKPESNLGWRVLSGCLLRKRELNPIIRESHTGAHYISLLPRSFVRDHNRVLEIIRSKRLGKRDLKLLFEY